MEKVTIVSQEKLDNGLIHYKILINEEDHTLAHILKESLLTDDRITFVGYRIPHLLEKKVEFSITTGHDVKAILKEHSSKIALYIGSIKIL